MRRVLPLLLFLLLLPACYKRTVATRGLGATGARVQAPYRSETAADRAVDRAVGRQTEHMTQYDPTTYDEKR
jgi:hypothetical protein